MSAALAVIVLAVAGTHARVIAAPAYGLEYGHEVAIAAPAYGLGYGHAAIAAPVGKLAHDPIVSSYSTVTKHVAAAPVVAKVAAPVVVAAPAHGHSYGAALAAPVVAYSHGYGLGKVY